MLNRLRESWHGQLEGAFCAYKKQYAAGAFSRLMIASNDSPFDPRETMAAILTYENRTISLFC